MARPPARRRTTNCSVTCVSGTNCYLCVGSLSPRAHQNVSTDEPCGDSNRKKLLVVSRRGKWHRLLAGNHAVFPGSTEPEVRVRVPRKNMKGSHKPSKNRDRYHSELLLRLGLERN